jgi:hypothetical protein
MESCGPAGGVETTNGKWQAQAQRRETVPCILEPVDPRVHAAYAKNK